MPADVPVRTIGGMDATGIAAESVSVGNAQLNAQVQFSLQRTAHDVVESQVAQLLHSVSIPAGLTFTPNGPSAGAQRNFIADL